MHVRCNSCGHIWKARNPKAKNRQCPKCYSYDLEESFDMEVKKRENRVKKLNSKQELKSEIRQPPNFDLIKIGERIMKVSDLNVGLEEMVKIYELAEEWECSPETVINTLVYRNEILTNSLKKAKECVKEIPMDEELPEETKNSVRSCLAYFLVEIGRRVELAQDFTKRSQSPE